MKHLVLGMLFFFRGDSPYLASAISSGGKNNYAPLVQCTSHMCPVRVHWHVKLNYKEYWRVKVTITNFNYRMNYTQWNLVAQHPNFDNLTQIFSFNYKPLTPYQAISKLSQSLMFSSTGFHWFLSGMFPLCFEPLDSNNVEYDQVVNRLFGISINHSLFRRNFIISHNALSHHSGSTKRCQMMVVLSICT